MRNLRAGFALALVMLVCAAPAAAVKDTLVIGMPTHVPISDTHKTTGLHNGSILNQVSEPLVLLTTKGEVVARAPNPPEPEQAALRRLEVLPVFGRILEVREQPILIDGQRGDGFRILGAVLLRKAPDLPLGTRAGLGVHDRVQRLLRPRLVSRRIALDDKPAASGPRRAGSASRKSPEDRPWR